MSENMITKRVKFVDVPDWSLVLRDQEIFELEKIDGPAISDGVYSAFIHRLNGKETIPAIIIGGWDHTEIEMFVYETD